MRVTPSFAIVLATSLLITAQPASAVSILYDFEGDTVSAIDKLAADGEQNGTLQNNVLIQGGTALFGLQSAQFDVPLSSAANPPFSTFDIADSIQLGEDFTLALHVDNQEAALDFTRLISSFRGTGAVGSDRVLFDYDPTGGVIPGLRAIVNNTVVQTAAPPAGITDPGYHHFALTVDSGDVRVYFDGTEVASGSVGLGYSNTFNLQVGEDPHDLGGSANEQLIGDIDDVLVINRTLTPADIIALSTQPASSVITPLVGEYAAYYDFEGDTVPTVTDKFVLDGANDGTALQNAGVGGIARFGSAAGDLAAAVPGSPFSQIEVGPIGNLGSEFTLSTTFIQTEPAFSAEGLTRLFSTFSGSGSPAGQLILDINHDADVGSIAVRLILPDGTVVLSTQAFSIGERHTVTATYNNGDVRLYLDGAEVANGSTAGDVDLGILPLFIGEDAGGPVNENFIGFLDDVLILTDPLAGLGSAALTASEVALLHQVGANEFLAQTGTGATLSEPPTWPLMVLAFATAGLLRKMSREPIA